MNKLSPKFKKILSASLIGILVFISFLAGAGTMMYFGGITIHQVNISAKGNIITEQSPDCYMGNQNGTYMLMPTYIYTNHSIPITICNLHYNLNYKVQMNLSQSSYMYLTLYIPASGNDSFTYTYYNWLDIGQGQTIPDNAMINFFLWQGPIVIDTAFSNVVSLPYLDSTSITW